MQAPECIFKRGEHRGGGTARGPRAARPERTRRGAWRSLAGLVGACCFGAAPGRPRGRRPNIEEVDWKVWERLSDGAKRLSAGLRCTNRCLGAQHQRDMLSSPDRRGAGTWRCARFLPGALRPLPSLQPNPQLLSFASACEAWSLFQKLQIRHFTREAGGGTTRRPEV